MGIASNGGDPCGVAVGRPGEWKMSSWFGRWFAYGLGRSAGRVIFDAGDDDNPERSSAGGPVLQRTEEEILEAERRYDEEAKRYQAEDDARRAAKKRD